MLTLNQVCVVAAAPSAHWLPPLVCVYAADAGQIYQAMEERWPYFKKLGQTFRVSRLDAHNNAPLARPLPPDQGWRRSTPRLGSKHIHAMVPSGLPPKDPQADPSELYPAQSLHEPGLCQRRTTAQRRRPGDRQGWLLEGVGRCECDLLRTLLISHRRRRRTVDEARSPAWSHRRTVAPRLTCAAPRAFPRARRH